MNKPVVELTYKQARILGELLQDVDAALWGTSEWAGSSLNKRVSGALAEVTTWVEALENLGAVYEHGTADAAPAPKREFRTERDVKLGLK